MKLAILFELLDRLNILVNQPDCPGHPEFSYLHFDSGNHTIVTKEGTKIEVLSPEETWTKENLVMRNADQAERIIYGCVSRYQQWRESCLNKAACAANVNEVLDVCASMLANPVAFFDDSLVLTAYSGMIPAEVKGTIWEEVLAQGLSRPEIYSKEEADMIASQLKSGKKSFVWKSQLFKGQTHICAQVCRGRTPCGILGASDLHRGFSEGEAMLVEDTSDFISLFYSSRIDPHNETNLYYIERMLNGLSVNQVALARSIAPLKWNVNDTFQVFAMQKDVPHEYANASFLNRIQKKFMHSLLMIHEERLVLISNLSQESELNIEKVMNEYGFALGSSFTFRRLDHLYESYVQALIALSYAQEGEYVRIESAYSRYVLESISKITDLNALCFPAILELAQSKDETDRILIDNLKMYMLCGRSVAETARKLFIHRNTLLYRLEKLSKLLKTDLSALSEQDAFILLFSCMIAAGENG